MSGKKNSNPTSTVLKSIESKIDKLGHANSIKMKYAPVAQISNVQLIKVE